MHLFCRAREHTYSSALTRKEYLRRRSRLHSRIFKGLQARGYVVVQFVADDHNVKISAGHLSSSLVDTEISQNLLEP